MTSRDDTGDPNRCRLELHVADESEARALRSKIQPLLVGIDPSFFYVSVQTPTTLPEEHANVSMEDLQRLARMNQAFNARQTGTGSPCAPPGSACEKLRTPAISVMLFLKETSIVSCTQAQNLLKSPPWKFHHKIELSNARRGQLTVIGRQEFYQSGRQKPLWSVCPVHYGNLHLRFTIFTRNFSSMVDFYRLLVGHEAEFTRENFCLFTVYSRPGLDLQLAIKQSAQLHPAPLSSAFLNFRVPNISQLEAMIHTPNGMAGTLGRVGDNLWMIQDPDSNCILVEQTNIVDHVRSSLSMVTTDAHNGNHGRKPSGADPFRRSRMLKDRMNLVKEYKYEYEPSLPPNQQYRGFRTPDPFSFKPRNHHRDRWPLPLYSQYQSNDKNYSAPWSDQSSFDSGRHSWRSGQETAGSSSDQSAQSDEAETSAVLCDCHVITVGRCAHCIGRSRSVLAPLDKRNSVNLGRTTRDNSLSDTCADNTRNKRTKPWEIEPPELSEVEWDGLLSLADSDDVVFR